MAAAYMTIDHKMNDELKAIFDRFHEDVALYNELITREEELLKSQASLQNTDQRQSPACRAKN